MKILDGKKINTLIQSELADKVAHMRTPPRLCIIQIGDNPVSNVYIARKIRFARLIGAHARVLKFPGNVSLQKILIEIHRLNVNRLVHGIIVQLPLPQHLPRSIVIDAIHPAKDVDGLTSTNTAKLLRGESGGIMPATTRGIAEILDYYNVTVSGKRVVVIGRSNLVGKPTAAMLVNKNATVTVCHSKTRDIGSVIRNADVIISAVGKSGFLSGKLFSKKQMVIDVGISFDKKGNMVGDVALGQIKVKGITPVPGGVGPMTVACLFRNLTEAAVQMQKNRRDV